MRKTFLFLGLFGAAMGPATAENRSVQYGWSFPQGNLVANWSFENQSDQACQSMQSLQAEVDCHLAFPASPSGGHVMAVYVYLPASSGSLRAHRTDDLRVQGGMDYALSVSANFWAGASLGDIRPEVEFFDEARVPIQDTTLDAYHGVLGSEFGSWRTYTGAFRAPERAAFARVSLATYQTAEACQILFDNFIITTGTNPAYVENRVYGDALGNKEKEVLTDGTNDVVGFTEYDNLRRPLRRYAPIFGGVYAPFPGPRLDLPPLFTVNAMLPNSDVPDFPNLDEAYDSLVSWAAERTSTEISQEPIIAVVVDQAMPEVIPTADIEVASSSDSAEVGFTLEGVLRGTRKHLDLLASLPPAPPQPAPPPLSSIPSYFDDPAAVVAVGTFENVYPGENPFHSEASYPNPGVNTISASALPGAGYDLAFGHTDREGWAFMADTSLLANSSPPISDLEVTTSALTAADLNPYFYQWGRDRQGNYAVTFTDAEGRVQKSAMQKAGGWITTSYEYDSFLRQSRTISPEGKAIAVTYDGRGRVVTTVDPDRGSVHATYDDRDRLRFTRHSANPYFSLVKYDLLNRALGVAKVADLTALTQANADNPDYPVNSMLEQGNVFDALTAETLEERTGLLPGPIGLDLTWLENTQGKLVMSYKRNQDATVSGITVADRLVASFYSYDDRGRLSGVFQFIGPAPSGHKWHKIAYFYDEQDRLERRVVYKDAGTIIAHNVTYKYDVRGRVQRIMDETGATSEEAVEYQYDPLDRMAGVSLYDDVVMSMRYDIQGKTRFIEGDTPGQNVFAQYLGYEGLPHDDLPGNAPISAGRFDGKIGASLLKYSTNVVGAGTQPIEYRTYAYLPHGPLSETRRYQGSTLLGNGEIDFSQLPFGSTPVQTMGYSYGEDGGFNSQTTDNSSGADSSVVYTYQSGTHQLGSVTRTVGGTPVTNQFTYDAEGRMTAQIGPVAKALSYDFMGMPTNIASGAVTQHYFYGPDNFRVATYTEEASSITKKKVYVYEEGLRVAKEIQNSGASVQTRVHLYGQGELVGVMDEETREKRLFVKDHQGSIVQVVSNNAVTQDETYFADYGELAKKVNSVDGLNPSEGWTGKEFEEDIGLTYFGARFYDPVLGVWLTVDPMNQYLNPYSYAGGDPINQIDPNGMFASGNLYILMGPDGPYISEKPGSSGGQVTVGPLSVTSQSAPAQSSPGTGGAPTTSTASAPAGGGNPGNAANSGTGTGGGSGKEAGNGPGSGGGTGGGKGGLPSRGDYASGYVGSVNFYRDYGMGLMQQGGASYVVGQGFEDVFKNPVTFAEGFVINTTANMFPTNATEGALAVVPLALYGVKKLAGATRGVKGAGNSVYHYTDEATAEVIERSQLGLPGRTTYLTPNGGLSPTQAGIELALPQRNTAQAVFEVSAKALNPSKISRTGRVAGNVNSRGGGGTEILYEGAIPRGAFRRVR